ncbi:hypothetical protein Cylst_5059 [Cylindrospermum stagnale PCC 7417]|uniref:Uncharacterized protein n=1 Tax=Cylindrospermum stagnale PCC 7417 TaxID=56107 RepID=K9X3A2_9NOST|nr:hypothetical protein [Cylindrospermum stagnale]AFZ27105.1 hypothetical protein Cylst_5059 [Cylindrospermum stagnale PCC 7417]
MRQIFLELLLSFSLTSPDIRLVQEHRTPSDLNYNLATEAVGEDFYTTASRLVQQQIYLIARLEQALTEPDPNRMRSVRGQLTIQTKSVEGFLRRQYSSPKTLCTPPRADSSINLSPEPVQLTESQAQIYCSLYASSQELLKLSPVIDQLLSRRGELALVRQLPLVTGERQFDPVLPLAPVQRPNLGKPATPFSTREPDLTPSPLPIVGRDTKTAIANYQPPIQPAIAPLAEALTTLKAASKLLKAARGAFSRETQFIDPQETAATLDRFAYDIDPQEPQTYAKLLELSNTGIFRVLPDSAYRRQLNTLQNRLQASVSQRYPFPSLGENKEGFSPSLALQMDGDNFHLVHQGVDYGFMVDVGDIPLEKLDGRLQAISSPTREFFLNYQPPQQLEALQADRQRFLTGKNQNWQQSQVILADAKAELNHTYVVRSLQFQLPEIILSRQLIQEQNSRSRAQLGQLQSSDLILAFRPVRRRKDGSYTVIWRVLNRLPAPTVEDLANYLK